MDNNKKGSKPAQLQAFTLAPCNDTATSKNNTTTARPTTRVAKKYRAFLFILLNPDGVTENDILRHCRLSSGRNYISEIERKLGFKLHRKDEPNPDGIGSHYRYRITNKADAKRLGEHITRRNPNAPYLLAVEIERMASQYPDSPATDAAK